MAWKMSPANWNAYVVLIHVKNINWQLYHKYGNILRTDILHSSHSLSISIPPYLFCSVVRLCRTRPSSRRYQPRAWITYHQLDSSAGSTTLSFTSLHGWIFNDCLEFHSHSRARLRRSVWIPMAGKKVCHILRLYPPGSSSSVQSLIYLNIHMNLQYWKEHQIEWGEHRIIPTLNVSFMMFLIIVGLTDPRFSGMSPTLLMNHTSVSEDERASP
jgi:hypothetical protein